MTTAIAASAGPSLPSVGDLSQYLRHIGDIAVLDADEERNLAQRLRDHDDLDAARRLIMAQLRFVVHIARGYNGYGLPLADLVQEGNIGLMKAVRRFDPEMGVRLISFAVHWIKAEIHEYVIRNWRIVKIATTKAQRKLFFRLRSNKKRLGWFSHAEVEAVANDLGVPAKTVVEMEQRLSGSDTSFDLDESDDSAGRYAPAHYLSHDDADPAMAYEQQDEEQNQQQRLTQALGQLDTRSRDIVARRWLSEQNKPTLHELAAQYGISAERVRQIEKAAMDKLRLAM